MSSMIIGILAGGAVGLIAFVVYVRVSNNLEKKRSAKRRTECSGRSERG